MIQNERDIRHEHILNVARQMMTAARDMLRKEKVLI